MRVLGVDPGMTRLGIAAVHIKGNDCELLTFGMIAHPRDPTVGFNRHLAAGIHQIADDFPKLINIVQPDYIAMELVPVGKLGSNDALVIAAACSVRLLAYQFGIPVIDLAASTVKKEFTGDGKATKPRVRNAVLDAFSKIEQRHAKLKKEQKEAGEKPEGLPQDVFDAVAIAIVGAKLHANKKMQAVQEREASNAVHTP
jgi:Holliday junction resolvasome RuvABC endonuclease subunit